MRTRRRLVAAIAASALGWTTLTLVVTTPAAQAAPGASASADKQRRDAPHDPATYYAGTEGLTGSALKGVLNDIIDGNTQLTYAQVYDYLPVTDEDPLNSSNLTVFYSGTSLLKTARCGGGSCAGQWNREHTWPQSHGDLNTTVGPGTDLFHMRPEFADTNSSRGNKDFDNGGTATVPSCSPCRSTGSTFEPRAAVKGDLARGLMYMDVRFEGEADDGSYSQNLELADATGTSGPRIGKLSTLVAWSLADPPDNLERARNDLVDGTYQHNRNPFIDHPEWVCAIWGSQVPTQCAVAPNNPPTTSPMTQTTAEDTPTTVALVSQDVDGDPRTWSITPGQGATHGTATISGSNLSYTPAANYAGTDVIGVTVSDGRGGTASTTVTITITPVNDPPTTAPMTKTTSEDTATTVALVANDVDGDSLTWSITSPASHGTAGVTGSTLSYSPAANFHGSDTIGVQVDDGHGGVVTTTVTITVTPVNDAPVANPTSASTPRNASTPITLSGSDVDGDALTFAIAGPPGHGDVSLSGGVATYTPATDYFGDDSFTFTAKDPSGATSAPATVSITVTNNPAAPVATGVSTSTAEDTPTTFTLTATDPNGDPLTYALGTDPGDAPDHGSVDIVGNQATYTPAANFHGTDSFTWTVTDGSTTVEASATIVVSSVNDAPTAANGTLTTPEDTAATVVLSAADVDLDPLTFVAGEAAHGTVSLSGSSVTYTPDANFHGADAFTFTASDGTATSAPATVAVTVTSVNDAPQATATSITTAEDTAKTVTLVATDVDSASLTYDVATDPAHGSVSIVGAEATYTPAADYHGTDSFTWTVSDGSLETTGTATITVTAVNDAPTAGPVAPVTTAEDSGVTIPLVGDDVDGDALTYAKAGNPAHGTVVVSGSSATYTPDAQYSGPDSFTYTVGDGTLTSSATTVTIDVTPVNDAPTVQAELLQTTAGTPVSVTLMTSDEEGDTVAVTDTTEPTSGSVTVSGTTLTYTPSVRSGTDSFFVTVSDGNSTATAQIGVEISARTAILAVSTPSATRGRPVTTTIAAAGPAGPKPSGQVTLKNGATTVGTGTLDAAGIATVTWTPTRAGTTSLTAAYAGDGLFAPTVSAAKGVPVARTTPALSFGGKVKAGKKGRVKVTIAKVAGVSATGTVRLKVGKKTFTATLKGGVATFKIGRVPDRARLKVTATYAGDGQYLGRSAKKVYKLR